MVFSFIKTASVSAAALGFGGLGLFGGNEISKKTISDSLGEVKLVSESSENTSETVWGELFSYFLLNDKAQSKKFKDLFLDWSKRQDLREETVKSNSKELEKVCKKSSVEIYSSFFGNNNNDLMFDVQTFCSIKVIQLTSISPKLLNFFSGVSDSVNKKDLIENLKALKGLNNKDPSLDSDLLSIRQNLEGKTDVSASDENINSLFQWCKKKVDSYYVSRIENKLDLVEKYCKRKETPSSRV